MQSTRSLDHNPPAISLRAVNKFFASQQVLFDVDLQVQPGEVVVIIGPSGSGKSTLCRCINRLEAIDSGEIFLHGERLPEEGGALAKMRAKVGMVFQNFNLFAHRTAMQNVAMGPRKVLGMSRQDADAWAMQLLEHRDGDSKDTGKITIADLDRHAQSAAADTHRLHAISPRFGDPIAVGGQGDAQIGSTGTGDHLRITTHGVEQPLQNRTEACVVPGITTGQTCP